MKESILNVLLYLFEHYIYDHPELVQDPDTLQNNLIQAGFSPAEVSKAFDWLETLAQDRPQSATSALQGPMRLFAEAELDRFDVEARGFLMFLEQRGVISAEQRELVIDRAMAVSAEGLDLDDIKIIVLMVFWSLGEEPDALILDELFVDPEDRLYH